MARGDYPSSKQDQFMVRFPDGLRDRLKDAAVGNGRSMNAEIVRRLEQSFTNWPEIRIDDATRDRIEAGTQQGRDLAEFLISEEAHKIIETIFPNPVADMENLQKYFDLMVLSVPIEEREQFRDRFSHLVMDMLKAENGIPPDEPWSESEVPF